MPKKIAKTKARSSKRSASKVASKKVTKKVAGKTLGKKATKKAAGKKAGKKAANPLIPTRKRKGMLLLNPKPMTPRQKARLIRAFQMAYESHQKRLAEMADRSQDDS